MKLYFKLCSFIFLFFFIFLFPLHSYANENNFRILISGFGPFAQHNTNPTEELIKYMNKNSETNNIIKSIILPGEYNRSWKVLKKEIAEFAPDIVIVLGYLPESNAIVVETTARNFDRGFIDNTGRTRYGQIVPYGKETIPNEFPAKKIIEALSDNNVPAILSSDAGSYLCNNIFYRVMHYTRSDPEIKAGFFHVPSWDVKELWYSLRIIIRVIEQNVMKFSSE